MANTTSSTTTRKPTKVDRFNALLAIAEVASNPDLVEFINHEIELLDKKNASKKPTEKQTANAGLKDKIVDYLAEVGKACTVAEVRKGIADFEDATPQRVTALMYQLIADNRVERVVEKRVSYFKVVGE